MAVQLEEAPVLILESDIQLEEGGLEEGGLEEEEVDISVDEGVSS